MQDFTRALVVVGNRTEDRAVLDHVEFLGKLEAITIVDVNAFLDNYVKALSDIIDEDELRAIVLKQRKDQLQRMIEAHPAIARHRPEVEVLDGIPFIEIIKRAIRGGHDLIVKVAESDAGLHKRRFGSTDMHLMRKSPVPVWIVSSDHTTAPVTVLAAVDVLNDEPVNMTLNQRILVHAGRLAERTGAELHLMSAWDLPGEDSMRESPFLKIEESRIAAMLLEQERLVSRSLDALCGWLTQTQGIDVPILIHTAKGSAQHEIPAAVAENDADIVVMGTVGRTGIPGLFIGNTAESVLGDIDCSVLAVKPQGFLSPVDQRR